MSTMMSPKRERDELVERMNARSYGDPSRIAFYGTDDLTGVTPEIGSTFKIGPRRIDATQFEEQLYAEICHDLIAIQLSEWQDHKLIVMIHRMDQVQKCLWYAKVMSIAEVT
jgi:hypothetical protein